MINCHGFASWFSSQSHLQRPGLILHCSQLYSHNHNTCRELCTENWYWGMNIFVDQNTDLYNYTWLVELVVPHTSQGQLNYLCFSPIHFPVEVELRVVAACSLCWWLQSGYLSSHGVSVTPVLEVVFHLLDFFLWKSCHRRVSIFWSLLVLAYISQTKPLSTSTVKFKSMISSPQSH